MVKQGLLDQYGKPNDKTPKDWLTSYVDLKYVTLYSLLVCHNFSLFIATLRRRKLNSQMTLKIAKEN